MRREFVDANARYDELIGNHSEVIYNKLFIFINEVVTTGHIDKKVEISNRLKPFWTDEDSKINPKHISPIRYWINCNGMCFSNEQDCLHIGKSSRRYLVINLYDRLNVAKLQEHEELGTFEKIYNFIQSDKIKNLTESAPYCSIIFCGSIVFLFDFDIDSDGPTITFLD